ncbi:Protein RER1 [Wallemia ichthyophaga EXF-994]|uniref:Protein RER1 n=1 Tax=Wallemia ichthyophaga (strain EXF-994 / CBS 113033) TaxID=1299270 RepID=R9AND6_WALI9|nr:Protein RER1 [Wallemia ichthyophaga EXF-994]EOR03724.1 Protein RER1 [Wallemia ichthyophaga EXF-994]
MADLVFLIALYSSLNLFLAFLTPKFDPSIEEDEQMDNIEGGAEDSHSNSYGGGGGYGLGAGGVMDQDEEFRPFIRRLPEFKFWYSATRAIVVSLLCTTTQATDIPVYWPILLLYFFILFSLTMRRQIEWVTSLAVQTFTHSTSTDT